MTDALTAIFCTLVLAAGWYYLTQSSGVEKLSALESPRRNTARRKARRLGAWSMIVLGASLFWMMWELQGRDTRSATKVGFALLLVSVSLVTMVLCAMIDVYLTMRLRKSNRPPK